MFSERSVHLITSCTKGKNHQGHVWPTLDIDPKQTPDDAAYAWSNIVDDARSNQAVPALSLYSGNHWSRGLTLSGTKTHVKKSFFNIIEAFIRVIVS